MKILYLICEVLQIFSNINQNKLPKLPTATTLSYLCYTKQFYHDTISSIKSTFKSYTQDNHQQIRNWLLIKLLIKTYPLYFIIVTLLGILGMLNLIIQPFINDKIKQIIGYKYYDNQTYIVIEVIVIFVSAKIITGLLNIVANNYDMLYGVKIYNNICLSLIKSLNKLQINIKFITCIEDDCQRLQKMPYSFINSCAKIIQGIVLSTLLISKLPISLLYWIFFIVTVLLAVYSSKLNLAIMQSKQKRIQFNNNNQYDILQQRQRQLKDIEKLMVVDGASVVLPWFINVLLMATVYGIVDLPTQDKYFIMLLLGLLRISITGLGSNMSLFAQQWVSLSRISACINDNYNIHKTNLNRSQSQEQQHLEQPLQAPVFLQYELEQQPQKQKQHKNYPISSLLQKIKELTPNFYPIIILLSLTILIANFMYGYTAKSLLQGQSIFTNFNMITLILQLCTPLLLFSFISKCNLRVSRNIYNRLFNIYHPNNQANNKDISNNHQLFPKHKYTPQQINRLTGDISMLDRQLYSSGYGFISNIMNIFASFLYSVVSLNNIFLIVILLGLLGFALWLGWLCRKFMAIRKQYYCKCAISKGKLLSKFIQNQSQNYIKPWLEIYSYKSFGYIIQNTYIAVLQFLLIFIATFVVFVTMLTMVSVQTISVVIMLISQLDSQFMLLFIQVIHLETITAAVCRCFGMLDRKNNMRKQMESM